MSQNGGACFACARSPPRSSALFSPPRPLAVVATVSIVGGVSFLLAAWSVYQGQHVLQMLERQREDAAKMFEQQREDAAKMLELQREDAAKMTAILQQVLDRIPVRSRGSSSVHDSPPQAASVESTISHSSSVHNAAL